MPVEKVKPIIGRVGGKSRLAPWIGGFIKKHEFSIYCEPFAILKQRQDRKEQNYY
jgi:hypothetical protein